MSGQQDALVTVRLEGYRAELVQDQDPTSPKEWDQVGTLVTWHRRYCFEVDGQKEFGTPEDFREKAKAEAWVYVLVGMIDHSGISLYADGGPAVGDAAGWDSGTVGYIYTTEARWLELCWEQAKGPSPADWREQAEKVLRQEIEVWDQYVCGDVYGVVVVREADDETVDSCFGFYGYDYARGELTAMLEAEVRMAKEEAIAVRAAGARL